MKQKIFEQYNTSSLGLTSKEVLKRQEKYGKNILPEQKPPSIFIIFFKQFLSPLIYILLFAATVSVIIGEYIDSYFIFGVLIFNALIGAVQEYSANKSALSLKKMVQIKTFVVRNGNEIEINAEELVPGDVIIIHPGEKVSADITLVEDSNLMVDESMLTGESESVGKISDYESKPDDLIINQKNKLFAGTIIVRGNAKGIVSGIGLNTEIGKIAKSLTKKSEADPPLVKRMEKFSYNMTLIMMFAILIIAGVSLYEGTSLHETFLLSAGLAVAAIPEGLPIAITITLAVGMNRMSKRNVIVRHLVAVESLGSCTVIASDKTGTLTLNELTATVIDYEFKDEKFRGIYSSDKKNKLSKNIDFEKRGSIEKIAITSVLANEGVKNKDDFHGDPVDIAFLKMAEKMGYNVNEIKTSHPEICRINYDSELKYAASFHIIRNRNYAFIKGAPETLLRMSSISNEKKKDIKRKIDLMAQDGLKVLGVAYRQVKSSGKRKYDKKNLKDLDFIALIGMIDPLRPEAKNSVEECHSAGIRVSMVTGDNPITAYAISKELGFVKSPDEVKIGKDLRVAKKSGRRIFDRLTRFTKVFARTEPTQKLDIVESLTRQGEFVAVTGDGVNDAPALKNAHVGVAMGKNGTDIARESSDIIITDDNFSSIVAGIEEGRVAYSNIRKLVFLLVSAGIAEIAIFIVAIFMGLPIPFFAAQLLWLNLVTEGIQDISLSLEKAEGDEMEKPPRNPQEAIFNRIMIKRLILSAIVMTIGVIVTYYCLINIYGWSTADARNIIIMLMVLFENMQVFNSRSENHSLVKQSIKNNPYVIIGTLAAMGAHILATYTPGLRDILKIHPISFYEWLAVLLISLSLIVVMELEKLMRNKFINKKQVKRNN
ncbi:cation-translocating P-type ATPase [Pseudomonadota bacterium]